MDNKLEEKEWREFRETGLLAFTNTILHVFGWAIALEVDKDGEVISAKPARTQYRGFNEESQDRMFKNITNYLKNNINNLVDDLNDGE